MHDVNQSGSLKPHMTFATPTRLQRIVSNRFPWTPKDVLSCPKYVLEFSGSNRFIFLDDERVAFETMKVMNIYRVKRSLSRTCSTQTRSGR